MIRNSLFKIQGFTLAELIVAVGIFLVVIITVSGIFVRSLQSQQITAALISINDNISLALEQMSREIRTGTSFCPVSSPCGPSEIVFTNVFSQVIHYRLGFSGQSGMLIREIEGSGGEPITSSDVKIESLRFVIRDSPDEQPRVTVALSVGSRNALAREAGILTRIQTTVSARTPKE